MDFFTKKELNGLKGDMKAKEIALNAEKESFKKKLVEEYGKQIDEYMSPKKQKKEKKCFIKKLFSINHKK